MNVELVFSKIVNKFTLFSSKFSLVTYLKTFFLNIISRLVSFPYCCSLSVVLAII